MSITPPKSAYDKMPIKLLLVDDDGLALEELCEIFELEDWSSVTASSIEDAMDMLEADKDITVVVTDVHFVDPLGRAANGIQFVSRAQARFPDRPLSYLVLSGDPDAQEASVQVGAYNFLNKPFLADELIEAVNKAASSGGGERSGDADVHDRVVESSSHRADVSGGGPKISPEA